MHPERQNNHNNPQLEIAMQWMVEVHTEMMRVLTQHMVNHDSNKDTIRINAQRKVLQDLSELG
jgi:hypothetical protein